jgi:formate dehydrogenase iron-sulfur subunit
MAKRKSMLIDVSKCMGCRGCQVACKQWNQLPAEKTRFTGTYQNPPDLSAKTWTLINFIEPEDGNVRWLFRKRQCLHCEQASCVDVCPTGAAKKRDDGIVYIDQDMCAGCKYCAETCPFNTPKYDHHAGTIKKCRMCLDRVTNSLKPACVTACPTGAVSYGSWDLMVQKGEKRLAALKKTNPQARLYGKMELGGLGALYVLPEKASVYGLPENPKMPTFKIFNRWLFGIIPGLAILYSMWKYLSKDDVSQSSKGGE